MNVTQDPDLIAAKTRLTSIKADQAELKLKIMQGEYVSVKEVEARQADEVSRVRTKLLALPAKLARQMEYLSMSAQSIEQLLMHEITEALNELSGGEHEQTFPPEA